MSDVPVAMGLQKRKQSRLLGEEGKTSEGFPECRTSSLCWKDEKWITKEKRR